MIVSDDETTPESAQVENLDNEPKNGINTRRQYYLHCKQEVLDYLKKIASIIFSKLFILITLSVKARFGMVLVPYRTKSRFGVCSWSSGQRFTTDFCRYLYLAFKIKNKI
ncbi:hypothetical protein BpHYR1_007854 [Brachionus plicatilis]|uniref:Uncharacterized protein n=1 Tax=Brachionus plicatilis TaxID=10195 RepID=A0A3M7SWU4_BRAPC|nr:hypothetical protein BpHYR1_007854 [Brachionus plicatilis]